ncbi:hypothetical protein SMD44_p10120 (plasmid) [Streptomyces alboflavus]|uniref:MvdD-like pre-ATP grasp domain-containing protein n=1 Tax=Streptomyces alboflavus TaxID=67267 RepID=A0A291W4W0_9ACTN|nr:ATP-grasp ribosomal peptide maturase [Streptomyces alboflavus]ATM24619.1 hypothetical protein SMD44_p10120 [Streptomyces alboflavus]
MSVHLPATGPVCIITQQTDTTADRVVVALDNLDIPVVRFDLSHFPTALDLSAVIRAGTVTGTLRAPGGQLIDLETVRSIFWWHPELPEIATGLPEPELVWARNEATAGLVGVLAGLECLHLNPPQRSQIAQNKALTLRAAADHGLSVPPFWIGNSLAGAQEFAVSSDIVCKSLTEPGIQHDAVTVSTLFTTPVRRDQLDETIAATAHHLQHAITKRSEVRLTVAGEEMFAAHITAHSPEARRDFRADYASLTYTSIRVPHSVRTGLQSLLEQLGLGYAACDFLIDRQGRWWLVDVNPAGQFAWIEDELPQFEISQTIARILANPGHVSSPAGAPAVRHAGQGPMR